MYYHFTINFLSSEDCKLAVLHKLSYAVA